MFKKGVFAVLFVIVWCGAFSQHSRFSDSLTLVKLFQSTDGNNWSKKDNWLSSSPLATWQGVTLEPKTGRVLKLHLYNNNLSGELPDELASLDSAKSIILAQNNLHGNIPFLNSIPFYKNFNRPEWNNTPFQLWYEDFPLAGNKYEFSDAERDTSILNRSYSNELIPNNAYQNVLASQPFGAKKQLRLSQGATYTFTIPYKSTVQPLEFLWGVQKGEQATLVATTTTPTFQIAQFDSTVHEGIWTCTIKRKNERGVMPIRQQMLPAFLASVHNKKPTIYLGRSGISAGFRLRFDSVQVKVKGQPFEPVPLSAYDDMPPEQIVFSILRVPTALQVHVDGVQKNVFTGKGEYEIQVKSKDTDWVGKDSLVIQAKDNEGGITKSVYVFESVRDSSLLQRPVIDPLSIEHKATPQGTWIYFRNAEGAEEIGFELTLFEEIDTACGTKDPVMTNLPFKAFSDSMFIPQIKAISNKDVTYTIYMIARNRAGTTGQSYAIAFNEQEYGKIPASYVEFKVVPAEKNVQIRGLKPFKNCGSNYTLFQWTKGDSSSKREVFPGGVEYYEVEPGISYSFVAVDATNRFRTDTFNVNLPRTVDETPVVTGSLIWEVQCEKRIKKSGWLKNYYAPLKWEIASTPNFQVVDKGDMIGISPLSGNVGVEKIPIRITDGEGYVLDTFALVSVKTTNSTVRFTVDTARINIKSTWTPFNLLQYVSDTETPDSLMELSIIRKGKLKLMDANFRTEILPYGLKGADTLSVFVRDEGCATALMSFVITFDTTGIANKAPYFPDNGWLYTLIPNLAPQKPESYYYAEDTFSFPTQIDLRQYVVDDQPFEELSFSITEIDLFGNPMPTGTTTIDKGLDIAIKDGLLTIRPRPNQFYGYPYLRNGRIYTSSFWFRINVKDKFGDSTSSMACYFNVANKPGSGQNNTPIFYNACPQDSIEIDVREIVNLRSPGMVTPSFAIFEENIVHTMGYVVQGERIKLKQNSHVFTEQVVPLSIVILRSIPFYDMLHNPQYSSIKEENIYIKVNPICNMAPSFLPIPKQKMTQKVSLWDKVIDEQQGKDLFWFFKGGKYINYAYNYETGELSVVSKQIGWAGVDTVYVVAEDLQGKRGAVKIVYSSESPDALEDELMACKSIFYPNPVGDVLTIQPCSEVGVIAVTDVTGVLLEEKRVTESGTQYLNVGNLKAGIYFIIFKSKQGEKNEVKRIIVH